MPSYNIMPGRQIGRDVTPLGGIIPLGYHECTESIVAASARHLRLDANFYRLMDGIKPVEDWKPIPGREKPE